MADFAPHSAFQRIDRNGDNKITASELLEFLRDHQNTRATEQDCYQIVRYFDCSELEALNFTEYVDFVI